MTSSLTLGLIGGLGPAATLDFLATLQAFTPAETDSDHIRVIADINPHVPDLAGPLAGPVLAEMAGALAGAGADVLAIACNAAHAHADLIQRASGLPLIDMIETAASAAGETEALRVGVLGGRGALRLYREYLAAQAMSLVSLDSENQQAFMAAIDRIKAGERGDDLTALMGGCVEQLQAAGAEIVIFGCTEIPLVLDGEDAPIPVIDAGELLAERCVAICLGEEPPPPMPGL